MRKGLVAAIGLFVFAASPLRGDSTGHDLDALLKKINAVGREGEGNAEASKAWKVLVAHGLDALFPTLKAFDDKNELGANWLRNAVDTILSKALADKKELDAKKLEAFILDTKYAGQGRRLAYEWLVRLDKTAPDRLLPRMLDDPGHELRRDAVARAIEETKRLQKEKKKEAESEALWKLFPYTRDRDQVDQVAQRLEKLGIKVDRQTHYGVIPRWILITTFDNSDRKGYDIAYPPEKEIDLNAEYTGKEDKPIRFIDHTTKDPRGEVDLNKAVEKVKSVIAYAYTVVESPEEREVDLRVGTNNAVKIFQDGKQIFFRNEYHHGMLMDQYICKIRLRKGDNVFLFKICQNEQKEKWTEKWSFQARLCDSIGRGIPFKVVPQELAE